MVDEGQLEFPEKVQRAIDDGMVWRAKEILSSYVAQKPYSPVLYEQYGMVLLSLGDVMEAGKYLFLSGAADPAYHGAIETYLDRSMRNGVEGLVGSWPRRAESVPLADLPAEVRKALAEFGPLPEEQEGETVASLRAKSSSSSTSGSLFLAGCLLVAAIFLILAVVVGFYQIVSWLIH